MSDHPGSRDEAPDGSAERLLAHRVLPARAREVVKGEKALTGRLDAKPLLAASLVVATIFLTAAIGGSALGQAIARGIPSINDFKKDAGNLGIDILGTACVALTLQRLGWWRRVGFVGPSRWCEIRLLILPAILALLALGLSLPGVDLSEGGRVALSLPQPFLTGFWEEGLTRGFFLFALLIIAVRNGSSPMKAVVVSSVGFGLMHLVALVGGRNPGATLTQAIYAALLGIGFSALLLRTNALWALVGLHALIDLGSALHDPVTKSKSFDSFNIGPILFYLPLALYGLYLLRRRSETTAEVQSQ